MLDSVTPWLPSISSTDELLPALVFFGMDYFRCDALPTDHVYTEEYGVNCHRVVGRTRGARYISRVPLRLAMPRKRPTNASEILQHVALPSVNFTWLTQFC